MAMIINIFNVPTDGHVAVYGMTESQETVNGDQLQTYENNASSDEIYQTFEINPDTPRVCIRARSMSLRWREDKEHYSKTLDSYSPEIVLEYTDGEVDIDLNNYLEHDHVMDEIPVQAPLITINNHDSYESIHKNQRINS